MANHSCNLYRKRINKRNKNSGIKGFIIHWSFSKDSIFQFAFTTYLCVWNKKNLFKSEQFFMYSLLGHFYAAEELRPDFLYGKNMFSPYDRWHWVDPFAIDTRITFLLSVFYWWEFLWKWDFIFGYFMHVFKLNRNGEKWNFLFLGDN